MSFPHLTSKNSGINQLGKAQEVTLKADTGFFDVSGQTVALPHNYTLTASSGTVVWTGTAAGQANSYAIQPASAGVYTITGTNAATNVGFYLGANFGTYSETGTAATLTYSAIATPASLSLSQIKRNNYPRAFAPAVFGKRKFNFVNEFRVPADPGNYVVTGTDASFSNTTVGGWINQREKKKRQWPRPFAPSPWGHLTTQRSINRIGYATASYALDAAFGTWTVTGSTVNFNINHVVAAGSGNWSWNTSAATLNKGGTLVAVSGSFVLTAPDTTLKVVMPAASGAWAWVGGILDFGAQRLLSANTGTVTIVGPNVALLYSNTSSPGSYIWTGSIATLRWSGETSSGRGGLLLLGAG